MKYFSVILLVLMLASCKNKQRDHDIARSIKSYIDTFGTGHAKDFTVDSIKTISVDRISNAKHLEMEIDGLQAGQAISAADCTKDDRGLTAFRIYQKQIDSIKAIKTNDQFWGYHVKAMVHFHYDSYATHDKENEMFFFVSKEYKTSFDAKKLLEDLEKQKNSN